MPERYEAMMAERMALLKASEIRELLKLTQQPDIISFAGGLPNPEVFPVAEIQECIDHVLSKHAHGALQYGPTEGHNKLRAKISERMQEKYKMNIDMHNVMITSGSQQALSILGMLFLNPHDKVIVSAPTYLGALQCFNAYQAAYEAIPLDNDGMRIDLLEEKLESMARVGDHPKLLYVIPTFQNPSGVTMVAERRKRLLDLAEAYDFIIVEDNPYGELRYSGDHMRTIKSYDDRGRVVYLGTFSKIFAPGLRLAWVVAPEAILQKMAIIKQSMDLCTNPFGQYVVFEFMYRGMLDKHIEVIKALYHHKRDLMMEAMDRHFPKESVNWVRPDGGMFTWVTLPDHVDTRDMFPRAIAEKVAYVVGSAFYPLGGGHNTMRLNFSYSPDEDIKIGIERLGNVIRTEIEKPALSPEVIEGV